MPPLPSGRRDVLKTLALASLAPAFNLHAREKGDSLPADQLQAAAKYCAQRKSQAFLVMQHGRVLHESYPNGGSASERKRIFSGTKGFWGLAALAAANDGILSLNEKASATLTEWRDKPGKEDITLRQLLDFTSGLERCLQLHEDGLANRNTMALNRPLLSQPGESFIYGPSALQVFHEVLKRKLAKLRRAESPTRYLERKVLGPMGLGSQRYLPDKAGNPLLAAGFLLTAKQWARMGTLLLNEGKPVLSSGSFDHIRDGSEANKAYSFGFWNNLAAGRRNPREVDFEDMLEVPWNQQSWNRACLSSIAPPDLIACIGSSCQRLYAVPSMNLVVVRQGLNARFHDSEFWRHLLGKR